ncbi:MAG: hypothetical protein D6778_06685, partial [Nitrospirae bacterium]
MIIDILTIIGELSPGVIFKLATLDVVQRGIRYFEEGRAIKIWIKNGVLYVKVRGSEDYIVDFSPFEDSFSYYCNCPAFEEFGSCKHLICALMTVKEILEPGTYPNPPFSEEEAYRLQDELENMLFGKEKESPSSSHTPLPPVVFSPYSGDSAISVRPEKDFMNIFVLLFDHFGHRIRHGESTLEELMQNQDRLFFEPKKDQLVPLSVTEPEGVEPDIRFILDDTRVRFHFGLQKDGHPIKGHLYHGKYLVDTSDKTITVVDQPVVRLLKTGIWDRDTIRVRLPYEKTTTVRLLQSNPVLLGEEEKDTLRYAVWMVNGKTTELQETDLRFAINIDRRDYTGDLLVRFIGLLDEGHTVDIHSLINDYMGWLIKGSHGPVRSKANRERFWSTLYTAMVEKRRKTLASISKAIEKEFKEDLKRFKDFTAASYRGFFRDLVRFFLTNHYYLTLNNNHWTLACLNKKSLLKMLFRFFQALGFAAPKIVGQRFFMIKEEVFWKNFGKFYEAMAESSVQITYNKKPIRMSSWNVSFEVQSGIDWFELKPKFQLENNEVDISNLRFLPEIQGNRLVVTEDAIEVLPPDVQKAMEILQKSAQKDRPPEIVRVPKLQILDYLELAKAGVQVKLPPEIEKVFKSLQDFKGIPERPLPEGLKATLRQYQKEGYWWLCFLYEHRFGGCLADDMGLGKTIQSICLLGALKEGIIKPDSGKHLVVVPPSLVHNWESELRRFYPDLRFMSYTGGQRALDLAETDVVITTYGIMRQDIEVLKDQPWDVVIFDEAQRLKNIFADTTGAARTLKARFKLALTGTPIENHLGEYYSIIDLVLPGLLGRYEEFMAHCKNPSKQWLQYLVRKTGPFVLRRTKEEILKELPPKTEVDLYLDMTPKQRALYGALVEETKKTIEEAFATKTPARARVIALVALTKLRRLCLSPALVGVPTDNEVPPKLEALQERLELLMDQGHSCLVFSQFTSFLDIVEEFISKNGFPYLRLDGSTPMAKRKSLVRAFQNSKQPMVFLVSLKAGGQGLNLTKATYVIHLDPWWNPAVEDQATDRTHRIGQKKKVTVIRFLMKDTIEEKMTVLKEKKQALYRALLE